MVSTSFLTLVLIPKSALEQQVPLTYERMGFLLIGVIIGVAFVSQIATPWLVKAVLSVLFRLFPGDLPLKPIVLNNLESHQIKNMKTVLMFILSICFLIYSSTCFLGTMKFLHQSAHVLFGADITLRSLSEYSTHSLNEVQIREVADGMLKENGGKVEAYSIVSHDITSQLKVPGKESAKDFLTRPGMTAKKPSIKDVLLQAAELSTFHAIDSSLVWYPGEMLKDPLGTEREYSSKEAIDLIHDLEPYSHFDDPFDRLNLLAGDPGAGRTVSS